MATVACNRDEPRVMSKDNHRNGYRSPLSAHGYYTVTTIITLCNNENDRNPKTGLPIYLFIIIIIVVAVVIMITVKSEEGALGRVLLAVGSDLL